MSVQPMVEEMIAKFRERMEDDAEVRGEVESIHKTVNIDLGTERYSMVLDNAEIKDFKDSLLDEADITLTTTPETIAELINGTLRPMRAYVTKKIQIKGKIQDLINLRKLL